MVNWTSENKLQWYFNRNAHIFIKKKCIWKCRLPMASISSRSQWVDHIFQDYFNGTWIILWLLSQLQWSNPEQYGQVYDKWYYHNKTKDNKRFCDDIFDEIRFIRMKHSYDSTDHKWHVNNAFCLTLHTHTSDLLMQINCTFCVCTVRML